ncbi:hypothetical protein D0Z67_14800 [Streptomyces seoulensis]|uniref:Uncharacterized protein n=1 Tax=Streptomyces seoulensis TaxID=73044 RepID=A0A4P6U0C5_STRSO|nr:hypothetical protein [Streptomyces seoulensis]QBJ91428.1 hypothetical protein D0Z67_14800 [Streptomyces seoulensis]
MTYQETFSSPPAESGDDEAEYAVRQYNALIEKSKAAIEKHNAAAREETERYELLIAYREEALSLVGMQSRLQAMNEHAREHGIFSSSPPAPPVALRVVPDPQTTRTTSPAAAEPEECTVPPATDAGHPSAEIIIRSKKQQEILNVIAQRPDPPWGSEDLARALCIPQAPQARKSLRNSLQALSISGALERITREDDRHVYYRPRMNWKFA